MRPDLDVLIMYFKARSLGRNAAMSWTLIGVSLFRGKG
jgi:hypothetical protein